METNKLLPAKVNTVKIRHFTKEGIAALSMVNAIHPITIT
jgi:hypothetical protein